MMPSKNRTRRAGSFTGRYCSMTAFISVKIAVFAPIPSAKDSTATVTRTGARPSWRTP